MAIMELGTCERCHGPLCISGQEVACERCAAVVPNHPAIAGLKHKPVPATPEIPLSQLPMTFIERLEALEKRDVETQRRLARLEERGKK